MRASRDVERKCLELAGVTPTPKRRSKYAAKRVYVDEADRAFTKSGDTFTAFDGGPGQPQGETRKVADSIREFKRLRALQQLQSFGLISNLQTQVRFDLTVNGVVIERYVADFVYVENGKLVVEDAKGMKTTDYRRKKKWMKSVRGIEIRES